MMKRLLSAILTLALVLSLVPAVFAADVLTEQKYEFLASATSHTPFFKNEAATGYEQYRDTVYYINSDYKNYTTNRNWRIFDIASDYFSTATENNSNFAQLRKSTANAISANKGGRFALALKATQTGFYIPQITLYSGQTEEETLKLRWYIYKAGTSQSYSDYIGNGETVYDNRVLRVSNVAEKNEEELFRADKVVYTQVAQELIAAFASDSDSAYRNYGITLSPIQNARINIELKNTDSRSVELDTTEAGRYAYLTEPTITGDNLEKAMSIAGGFVEYKSSNEKVATVANEGTHKGRIWAKSAGEAEIWVQSPDGLVKSEPIKVTVTPSTVSFAQTTNVPGYNTISVSSVNRGASVELTAHKGIDGYKFIGWKRGANASDENAWVDITSDTYTVWSNTYLTAIYEKETEVNEKTVEFWNQNGAYLGKATDATYATDVTRVPTLTGFGTFRGWFTDGNVRLTPDTELKVGTTNAVAQYEDGTVSGVTHNDATIADADTYNAPVELNATSNATTCWKRDGEIIAYGDTYNFNVWDATNITEGTEEITDKVPVAILDYSANHKAYMLEYDAGDYEIVEAGIIFGKDTVNVKTYTSQRKVAHNQFTVPEEDDLNATGYIIYTLDGGASYKTKYVSVK